MEKRYVDKTALEHFALKTKAYVDDTIASLVVTPTPPTTTEEWQPQSDWWDIEQILEDDTEDYPAKIICLLFDGLDDKATINTIKGFNKYKLSDGQTITPTSASSSVDISIKFDTAKDKTCSKGYKTRYIIGYSSSETVSSIELPKNVMYTIFSGVKFSNKPFQTKYFLEAVKFINNSNYTSTDTGNMFQYCYRLEQIPELDTSNITNMNRMFDHCSILKRIPKLDTSKATDISYMFYACYNLQQIPELDTSKATNMSNIFSYCYRLEQVPELDTSNITNMSGMFSYCYNLKQISKLDTSKTNSINNIFYDCSSLYNINKLTTINKSVTFSSSIYLNHASLIRILNALVNLTGQTTQTLTLGSTNRTKLTDTEKAIATNKNWTLA